jgi:V/A-type H+-transporting ATPase subunit I
MAVMQMQRISICAMKRNRKAILERLQQLGAVQIDIPQKSDDFQYDTLDMSQYRAAFEKYVAQAEQALEIIDQYDPVKKPLEILAEKTVMSESDYRMIEKKRDEASKAVSDVLDLSKQIGEKQADILKVQAQIESAKPWAALPVPVSYTGTKRTAVLIGTMNSQTDQAGVLGIIAQKCPEINAVDVDVLSTDKDYTYLTVMCLKRDQAAVEEALRTSGFTRTSAMGSETPAVTIEKLSEQVEADQKEIDELKSKIKEYGSKRQQIKLLSDYYATRGQKYEVLSKLPETGSTFALSGYIPAERSAAVAEEMIKKYDAAVEVEDPAEDEETPVLLHNNHFAESVDSVIASFGLPKKGEIDPTCITSFFFVLLFGMMLSDAAYGLVVSIVCGIVLIMKPHIDSNMRKSLRLFFYCGLSTVFWGVLFGGYFGDFVDTVSRVWFHKQVTIPAVWFMPLNDPMRLLLFSMLLGIFHMFVGLALKGYMLLRDRKIVDFISDVLFWYMLVIGLILMLMPTTLFTSIAGKQYVFPEIINQAAKWSAIIGAAGIVLTGGREASNPAIRLAKGAYSLYSITGWLSDILSYSRLLALGLATGVIANVINQMGSMLGDGVVSAILYVFVFLIGHTFNILINLLGAYVHTCRLQYVEFFGKFYEGGGEPFKPFNQNTKYYEFKEETNL